MNLFKKIAALSVGLAMAVGVGVAASRGDVREVRADDSVTFTVNVETGTTSLSKGSISVTTTSGTFSRTDNYRVYANSSMTISSSNGNIKSMSFAISQNTFTADVGTWSDSSWTGDSASVTLSASGGQVRFTTFTVTYTPSSTESHTITYNANGGTGNMDDTVAVDPIVSSCEFTAPEGKIFSVWNTAANGSGNDYVAGDAPGKDLDLYAIWVDKPICVTLDQIGASLGSTANTEMATANILDGTDSYTLNYLQCKKQTTSGNTGMFMTKSVGAFISNHTAMPGSITSVEVFTMSSAAAGTSYDVAFGASEYTEATAGIGGYVIGTGSSHVYENESVADAQYFCITLANTSNGQVLKIVVNYEEPVDPSLDTLVIKLNDSEVSPQTVGFGAGPYLFYANDEDGNDINSEWVSSNTTIATVEKNGNNVAVVTPHKGGTVTLTASANGYNSGSFELTINIGTLTSVSLAGTMTKTDYFVGVSWDPTGFTATANYSAGYHEDVTSSSSLTWNYSPASPAVAVTSVTVSASFGGQTSNSINVTGITVTRVNPLSAIYSSDVGTSFDVYGYFVGNKDGNNIIIMDGEYGMDVYKNGCGTNSYVAGETIIHVVGKSADFNGLIELSDVTTLEVVASADIDTPVVYACKGGETADYASRSTTVTGTPTVTKGDITADAGAADITLSFDLGGGKSVQVFYKKSIQTASADNYTAMRNAVNKSEEITVAGFTAWYNGFQVQMTDVVEAVESYTAEDFAADLLSQTYNVCSDSEITDKKSELIKVWNDLQGNDKYPSLPADQKTILGEAIADEHSENVVEQAMARYDYLVSRYGLSNFINGRTPAQAMYMPNGLVQFNPGIIIGVASAIVVVLGVGFFFAYRKKKQD